MIDLSSCMKKKILLLSDDIRSLSGVARISKDIVINTIDRFDWVQLAAKHTHEDAGQIIDVSESVNELMGTSNSYERLYPSSGYGDEITLTNILKKESPDAILHITDPRYWEWLYDMERSIRNNIPLCYYHVWDNDPPPMYNDHVYKSCDWIGCISRLTYDIVKKTDTSRRGWQTEYIPHGVCPQTYYPTDTQNYKEFKEQVCGGGNYRFIIFANNLNIPRKQLPTIISAYKKFGDTLTKNEQNEILLILHTDPTYHHGSNLYMLGREICPDHDILFSNTILDDKSLNYMYNLSDVTINVASAEGFGLATLESIMAGTPIIISKTGGLVDQVLTPDNTYGEWSSVVEPTTRNLIGNQATPYIYSDLCSEESVAAAILGWYKTSKEERSRKGLVGREFASQTLTNTLMADKVSSGIITAMKNFSPKPRLSCNKL